MIQALSSYVRSLALRRVTIHGVLVAGFVTLFALGLVFSYDVDRRLSQLESRAPTMQAPFAQSEGLLLTVAAQVLLGTVYVRDALLDTTPGSILIYQHELQNACAEIERSLQQYLPNAESADERWHWTRLRDELGTYWDATMPAITPELVARDPDAARTLLRVQAVPRRRTIIQISDQIRRLNREAFERRTTEVSQLFGDLRRDVRDVGGAALVIGLLVAFGATRYAGRLESRIRRQQVQETEQKRELERLSAQLVRAQEEERRTIARELHDEIGQALTAIKIELAVAQSRLADGGGAAEALAGARAMTDGAIHAVRDVSRLLHPAMLDTLGLADTVSGYLAGFAQRTGIRAELQQDDIPPRLSADVEICAWRIIQEALTNVARHARARSCRVELRRLSGALLVTIEDDGAGMEQAPTAAGARTAGLGLVGIRERVATPGGALRIDTRPDHGTHVVAELPLPDAADREAPVAGAAVGLGARGPSSC